MSKGGGPKIVAPGDITDGELTVGEMRAALRDIHEDLRWLREDVAPEIKAIKNAVVDLRARVLDLERHRHKTDDHLAHNDSRLDQLEAPTKKRKARTS